MSTLSQPLLMFNKYDLDKVRDSNYGAERAVELENREHEVLHSVDDAPGPNENVGRQGEVQPEEAKDSTESHNPDEEQKEEPPRGCDWLGWSIRIVIILALVSIAIWAIVDRNRLTGVFEGFIDWLRDNPVLAPFVLIFAYIIATILFLPGLILTLGAGFAFNQAYGNAGGKCFKFNVCSCNTDWVHCSVDRSYDRKYLCHAHW